MATSKSSLRDSLRKSYMDIVSAFLAEKGEEILQTASNEITLPCVDSEGNEEYLVLTFKIPTGSRDGESYDGHAIAEDYRLKVAEKAAKAEKAKAEKSAKIARDKLAREKRAKAKAEQEGK